MASAWGLAWGEAWNGAWGVVDGDSPAPPAPPAAPTIRPSGGFPSDRGPTKEQTRRSRIAHGIIREVAERQAQALDLYAIQQQQELREELRLRGIEAEIGHYEALVRQRQALIDAEIAQRLRQIILDDEAALVLIIAASL